MPEPKTGGSKSSPGSNKTSTPKVGPKAAPNVTPKAIAGDARARAGGSGGGDRSTKAVRSSPVDRGSSIRSASKPPKADTTKATVPTANKGDRTHNDRIRPPSADNRWELKRNEKVRKHNAAEYDHRYIKVPLPSGKHVSLRHARQLAVKQAWAQEQALINANLRGTRGWGLNQRAILENRGKVSGYFGHHMNSVVNNEARFVSDPNNIKFVTMMGHLRAHKGDFHNKTNVTEDKFHDRAKMLFYNNINTTKDQHLDRQGKVAQYNNSTGSTNHVRSMDIVPK